MKASEIVKAKLLKTWPASWAIFEESCAYTVANNLAFIKGVLLNVESETTYKTAASVGEQLCLYLREELGYNYIMWRYNGQFCTREGYKQGLIFTIFLTKATLDAYEKENDAFEKWCSNRGWCEKPPRPLWDQIEYLNIYKPLK